jgi:hypothetical protein
VRIRVLHGIDDLSSDMAAIAASAEAKLVPVVKRNVEAGQRLAQGFARAASGPHGRLYYKRITSEMTGALEGEFGPTGDVAGNAVGAGWRNRPNNLDQDKAADVVGPDFADEVGDEADGWFW